VAALVCRAGSTVPEPPLTSKVTISGWSIKRLLLESALTVDSARDQAPPNGPVKSVLKGPAQGIRPL
jgi:hypothetical protein